MALPILPMGRVRVETKGGLPQLIHALLFTVGAVVGLCKAGDHNNESSKPDLFVPCANPWINTFSASPPRKNDRLLLLYHSARGRRCIVLIYYVVPLQPHLMDSLFFTCAGLISCLFVFRTSLFSFV